MARAHDQLHIGLLVNPVAGLGGAVALAGSDGPEIQQEALRRGSTGRGRLRAQRFLQAVHGTAASDPTVPLRWSTWAGTMGAAAFEAVAGDFPELSWQCLGQEQSQTAAEDTVAAARALQAAGVDLLVFVGGDGTARDVYDAVADRLLVLGVPAGVKMHSGVFATTPEAAAEVVRGLASGALVADRLAQVRDLDEAQRRAGELRTIRYGEMRIPEAGGYVQQTKEGGRENEVLALEEIVAWLQESASGQWVLGPGSSCARVKEALGMQATLLGVDVWQDGVQTGTDVSAAWLEQHARAPDALVVSFIRAQGFVFGRGNQQLSTSWLAGLPKRSLRIIATRSKLATLEGRPLLVDTDDATFNDELSGLVSVLVGYDDTLLYRVASHAGA
ncbi:MAG: ATP-NAD kinase family protein [Pseudomonadales bacterium]